LVGWRSSALAVSLEDLAPQDHFYRHQEAKLDLSFVRDWARERYAERGRSSIDPVRLFQLQAERCRPLQNLRITAMTPVEEPTRPSIEVVL
jgi:hypothetical protein